MTTRRYAEGTEVAPEKSRAEIEGVVRRYGADSFVSGFDGTQAMVMFRAHNRYVRFVLAMPHPDDAEFKLDARKNLRTPEQRKKAAEAEERRRWRALLLAIKAKLEVVESGIATFDEEFLAHVVLPDGGTVGQWIAPQIDEAYERGVMPAMLPALGPGSSS